MLLKFPAPARIGQVRGSQRKAKEYYHLSIKRASQGENLKQTMTIIQRFDHDDIVDNTIDSRAYEEKRELVIGPVEESITILVDVKNPSKVLKLWKNLADETR